MTQEQQEQRLDLSFTRTTKDMAMAALVGAVIATLLIVFFYFTFRQDVSSTTQRLERIESRITSVEQQMDNLQELPEEVRRTMVLQLLGELSRNAATLQGQLQDEDLQQKMSTVQELVQDVQQSYQ